MTNGELTLHNEALWQFLAGTAITVLGGACGAIGYFTRRLIAQIDVLGTKLASLEMCIGTQAERWHNHSATHAEMREDRIRSEQDIWAEIERMKSKRPGRDHQ